MKWKTLAIVGISAFALAACTPDNNPPQPTPEDIAVAGFYVYKFKDPSYANYVLTNRYEDYFAVSSWDGMQPAGYWDNMVGKSPFIPLQDEYFLLDWRWDFLPREPILIFKPWSELLSWTQHWDTATAHIDDPVLEEYVCVLRDFDAATTGIVVGEPLRYCPYQTCHFSPDYQQQEIPEGVSDDRITERLTQGLELEEVEAYFDAVYAEIALRLDSLIQRHIFPLSCMYSYLNDSVQ